ncbi:MAG: serine/threonine-protein kinase [Candidatus Solibacter sp.]|nr:serine/threonine-protein kinase [Candidatus Solibacter sp.]
MNTPVRIGRYEIIRRLGKSMTDVYLAMDTVEHRKVALKLISHSDDRVTRLAMEAERRGAAIQKDLHTSDPRMVEIYEYGDLDGYFFVAMQFVEGRTVADVLAADRVLDPCRAGVIALEICEQLAKFHSAESSVVHGDIKPSNIHLGPSDTVRLLDFGIAKTLRADCDATGHEFGSPSYCSPERLTRAEVNPQSDLWALGATLYEMLSGVPPYQAEDTRRLEGWIRSKRPPRALPAACPAGLRAIIMKALAPDGRQRYRSAGEFRADLQLFLERKPTQAETERRPRWNPNATLEAARDALRRVTRTARRKHSRSLQVLGAAGYFATGMLLWIGGTLGWQVWQARASAAVPPVVKSPPEENLAQWYVAAADRILDAYRTSTNPWLYAFDWQKAEICLERAVQLGAVEDRTVAKLALARGYATLERLNGTQYSENAAAGLCPIPRRRWRSFRRRNGSARCSDTAKSSSRATSTGFGRTRSWRAIGGGQSAMPTWRVASTGAFPASTKPTGIYGNWTRSTHRRRASCARGG